MVFLAFYKMHGARVRASTAAVPQAVLSTFERTLASEGGSTSGVGDWYRQRSQPAILSGEFSSHGSRYECVLWKIFSGKPQEISSCDLRKNGAFDGWEYARDWIRLHGYRCVHLCAMFSAKHRSCTQRSQKGLKAGWLVLVSRARSFSKDWVEFHHSKGRCTSLGFILRWLLSS